jgi:hypothetical protein
MAWIRDNKVYEIVRGASKFNTLRKLNERYLSRDWKQIGEIKEFDRGYAALVMKEVKR